MYQIRDGKKSLPDELNQLLEQAVKQACLERGWETQADHWVAFYQDMMKIVDRPSKERGRPPSSIIQKVSSLLAQADRDVLRLLRQLIDMLLEDSSPLTQEDRERFLVLVGSLHSAGTIPTQAVLVALYGQIRAEE